MTLFAKAERVNVDLLLSGGCVITMDTERRIIDSGAVAIDAGRIVAIGTIDEVASAFVAGETMDCTDQIVMPGLIDAHGHGGHAVMKTIGVDTLSWWMRIATHTYFHHVSPNFWYADGLLAAAERLKFGVTCGLSVLGSQPRSDEPTFAANYARGVSEVGLRSVIGVGPSGLPWSREVGTWHDGTHIQRLIDLDVMMAGVEATIDQCHGADDGRILVYVTPYTMLPSLSPSGPTTPDLATQLSNDDREQARRVREIAARYNTRIHTDAFGGMVELASHDDYALLGRDVHIQHGFGLSNHEIEILAETGTSVTHAAGVVVGALRGRCPVIELLDNGVNVAITSDGCAPMSTFDLFVAMRQAQTLSQVQLRDTFVLPPGKLLEMVTIDAARALGLDNDIGSLEVGKAADIIAIDMHQVHLQPLHMPVHALVYKVAGQDVRTVIVAGRVVVRDRALALANESEILDRALSESSELIERGGLGPYVTSPVWSTSRQLFEQMMPFEE